MKRVFLVVAILAISFAVFELGNFSGEELSDISFQSLENGLYEQKFFTNTYMSLMIEEVAIIELSKVTIEEDIILESVVEEVIETPIRTLEQASYTNQLYSVAITDTGFVPERLDLRPGDSVIWTNERGDSKIKKAALTGTVSCFELKSPFLEDGDTFSYTFEERGDCTVVDIIAIGYVMNIRIE